MFIVTNHDLNLQTQQMMTEKYNKYKPKRSDID